MDSVLAMRWAVRLPAIIAALLWIACTASIEGPIGERNAGSFDDDHSSGGNASLVQCQPSLTACGVDCVDINSSNDHCGSCNSPCSGDQVCSLGVCTTECKDPYVECDESCVDLKNDANHCGSCDVSCTEGIPCFAGACGCPDGALMCNGRCVDPLSDNSHCGNCGMPCDDGDRCISGTCVPDTGSCHLTQCDEACVDTQASALHCGSCDNRCSAGQSCQSGNCQCTDPEAVRCNDLCVNLQHNVNHCGECGNTCTGGYPCTNGECACPDEQTLCSGSCVDTNTSLSHCGSCGNSCPSGETCILGQCSSVNDQCTSTLAHSISIREIAVLQAGKISIVNNGAPVANRVADVIAGKDGVVRVYVDTLPGFAERILSARLTLLNGDNIEQVFHKRSVSGSSSEASWNSTFNIEVPGALITPSTTYQVQIVECDGASSGTSATPQYPDTGYASLAARDVGTLKIRYIPINATNGSNPDTSAGRLAGYTNYVKSMFPVSGVETSLGPALTINFSINSSGDGWDQALSALRTRHDQDNAPNDLYYYGLFQPSSSGYCSGGCVAGIGYIAGGTSSSRHHRVSLGLSTGGRGSAETMAHEVGHNHGRPHSPCGGVSGADSSYPHSGGRIGWWGFELPSTLYAPTNSTDIMGYCSNQWVSDYVYRLFTDRVATINGRTSPEEAEQHPVALWRVVLTGRRGPQWTYPYVRPAPATGTPEAANILDSEGNVLLQVTVYRTLIDHLGASSVVVPEPQPGWHAIELSGEAPLPY